MIPKVINYCWFGKNKKPKSVIKCIESWKKNCTEYEIKEWNEYNFDIESNNYVKQAYQMKKYAFVTDYVRLYILYNYGGIYLDTDVEIISSLDNFLNNEMFIGFQDLENVNTGLIASNKNNVLIKEWLESYKNRNFIMTDGTLDLTTNVKEITKILKKYGLIMNNSVQNIENIAMVYSKEYFCPLDFTSRKMEKTKNTVAIHWFDGTWLPKYKRIRSSIARPIKNFLNKVKMKKC